MARDVAATPPVALARQARRMRQGLAKQGRPLASRARVDTQQAQPRVQVVRQVPRTSPRWQVRVARTERGRPVSAEKVARLAWR
jgi:hypothetical protein